MIVGDDAVAEEPHDARETIADDGRANVTDVHGLGDVRRTEIDDDRFRLGHDRHAEPVILHSGSNLVGDKRRFQPEVDKARAGDSGRFADLGHLKLRDDLVSQRPRVLLEAFGDRHDAVGLVVAELRIGTRTNQCRASVLGADGREQSLFNGISNDVWGG